MTDQTLADRPNEEQINELVWANNPTLDTPVKQMTRGKLKILTRSGYKEAAPPDWAEPDEQPDPPSTPELAAQQEEAPADPAAPQTPSGRSARAGGTEQKES